MPLLAALMAAIGTNLMGFLVKYFTAQIAIRLTFATMVITAFGVLQVGLNILSAGIVTAMPQGLVDVLAFALPSNTATCISAALAADAAVTGFRVFVIGLGFR